MSFAFCVCVSVACVWYGTRVSGQGVPPSDFAGGTPFGGTPFPRGWTFLAIISTFYAKITHFFHLDIHNFTIFDGFCPHQWSGYPPW